MLGRLQTFARTCDFFNVAFREQAPHFLATTSLGSPCPDAHDAGMFTVLRELVSIASASTY